MHILFGSSSEGTLKFIPCHLELASLQWYAQIIPNCQGHVSSVKCYTRISAPVLELPRGYSWKNRVVNSLWKCKNIINTEITWQYNDHVETKQ